MGLVFPVWVPLPHLRSGVCLSQHLIFMCFFPHASSSIYWPYIPTAGCSCLTLEPSVVPSFLFSRLGVNRPPLYFRLGFCHILYVYWVRWISFWFLIAHCASLKQLFWVVSRLIADLHFWGVDCWAIVESLWDAVSWFVWSLRLGYWLHVWRCTHPSWLYCLTSRDKSLISAMLGVRRLS